MQVIGLCRFSYPAEGGFQVEHGTLQERIDFLYAPERLEERFRTFEAFTLPALRAQTDGDFTLVIVVGDTLPLPYRARLDDLVSDMPQVQILSRPPGPHRQVMQDAINSVRVAKGPSLQFRMDDDDAVAVTYVERLREAARDVRGLLRNHRHAAIDFCQGYIARPGPEGIAAAPTRKGLTTAALAVMFRPGVPLSVMNFAHAKLGRRMPVVSFAGDDMLVRGHNDHNDSRQKAGVKPVDLTPLDTAGEAHFRTTFNIDADRVRALYDPSRNVFSR